MFSVRLKWGFQVALLQASRRVRSSAGGGCAAAAAQGLPGGGPQGQVHGRWDDDLDPQK